MVAKQHWLDETLFLIERYGYARREGTHQGKTASQWLVQIETKLRSVSRTLDNLQTGYEEERDEVARARGWNTDDEAMAFGRD